MSQAFPFPRLFTASAPSNNVSNNAQGAITKRITAIEEMAGMDILCSDKTGTLTLNKLTVDKSIIEVGNGARRTISVNALSRSIVITLTADLQVYVKDCDQETVLLMAARAARTENQDAIDTCIVGMLADPAEVSVCG